jgi:hypothetical protein
MAGSKIIVTTELTIGQKIQMIATVDKVVISILGYTGQSQTPVKLENPIEESPAQFRVEVVAKWTGWKRRQYSGYSMVTAVELAFIDMQTGVTDEEYDALLDEVLATSGTETVTTKPPTAPSGNLGEEE